MNPKELVGRTFINFREESWESDCFNPDYDEAELEIVKEGAVVTVKEIYGSWIKCKIKDFPYKAEDSYHRLPTPDNSDNLDDWLDYVGFELVPLPPPFSLQELPKASRLTYLMENLLEA